MAMEIFLRLDGMTGSVTNYAYKEWAAIKSWHWGMARATRNQGGSRVESVSMNRISIIKPVGIESPMLMTLFAARKIVPTAEIRVAPPAVKRGAQLKFIDIALENVLVQSLETGAAANDEEILETVVIAFAKARYEFFHNTTAIQGGAAASTKSQVFNWSADTHKTT